MQTQKRQHHHRRHMPRGQRLDEMVRSRPAGGQSWVQSKGRVDAQSNGRVNALAKAGQQQQQPGAGRRHEEVTEVCSKAWLKNDPSIRRNRTESRLSRSHHCRP